MKKLAVILSILLLFGVCGMTLTGCSTEGTYYFYSMGEGADMIEVGDVVDGRKVTKESIKITLNEDGTGIAYEYDYSVKFTWKENGDKIILIFEGGREDTWIKDGRKLISGEGGYKLVLKK